MLTYPPVPHDFCVSEQRPNFTSTYHGVNARLALCLNSVLDVKVVVADFSQDPSRGLLRDCENRLWNRWIVLQHLSWPHEYGVTIVTCSLAASSSPSWCGSLTSSRMPSSSRSSGTSSFPSCELTAVRLLDSWIVRSSSHGLKLPIMWVTVSAFQRQCCCWATANIVIMGPSLVYSLCLQLDYWIICNSTL